MWPFRRKKNLWVVSAIKAGENLVGTHLVFFGADRQRRNYPYVVFVTRNYEGNILPSPEEMDGFEDFEDQLPKILNQSSAIHVGIITWKGTCDLICYAEDGQAAANRIYAEFASYSPQIEIKYDPTWSEFRSFAMMSKGTPQLR